jgi:predicted metal-dependent hydrolase
MASDRDRDGEGRARSARPRDGLGRPLPYGSSGVERQPEGIERTPEDTIREGQRLLDEGKPFHAHEVFEDAWKTGPAEEADLWKGLAQLAVGLTHAARGNAVGSARLLRRGAEYIASFADAAPHGLDVSGLLAWANDLADAVEAGVATEDPAASAPRLRAG